MNNIIISTKNIEKVMTENLLQFIWQHRLYDTAIPLLTTDGEPIIVLNPGFKNTHAGTDFLEAKIKISNTIWVGNVEIHIKSSDWNKHKHEENEAYGKIILHVVYHNDAPVKTFNNTSFCTLALHAHLPISVLNKYELMMQSSLFIPCANNLSMVKSITIQTQLQRMLAERLEEKSTRIVHLLKQNQQDWQHVMYVQLARGFGLHINQDAFEQLAIQTPLKVIAKHQFNLLQIEALLFGQAGLLDEYFDEAYPLLLQQEYLYLKKLYQLQPIAKHAWKFLRLRPANFPTIRIAQFAKLMMQSAGLFSKIMSADTLKDIEQLFHIDVSGFWLTHFTLYEPSVPRKKALGKSFIHTLIINAIIPTMYMYGKLQGNESYCTKAIELLQQLPAENNHILTRWQALYPHAQHAADTQALLQLYNKYCDAKKCLACSIGYEILKQ